MRNIERCRFLRMLLIQSRPPAALGIMRYCVFIRAGYTGPDETQFV